MIPLHYVPFFLFVRSGSYVTYYLLHPFQKKANHSKKLCNVLIKGKIISLASIYYLYLALVDSSTLDQNAKKKRTKCKNVSSSARNREPGPDKDAFGATTFASVHQGT